MATYRENADDQFQNQLVHEATPTYSEVHLNEDMSDYVESTFASRYLSTPISKHQLPHVGAPAHVVYQLIKGIRTLDSTPRLNLASFVTTWMEPEAERLMMESLDVNYVDTEEYPSSTEIQNRCVAMLARLYHSPSVHGHRHGDPIGTATVGSSEAIMLGALSLKKKWVARQKAAGRPYDRPNLVMGSQAHVCWQKFCRYFDVEERYVFAEEGRYAPTPALMRPLIDENTVGVACILGSTFTGEFEDVRGVNDMLEEVKAQHGWEVYIHVDAASGGFVAPFLYPELVWDFRLPHVASINVSGHKYGLVFPGVGWVIWRDEEALSPDLVFEENYLGSTERSITLNFSKGASQIIAQYYMFLRLGRVGYTKIMTNLDHIRCRFDAALRASDHFEVVSAKVGVPLVAFRLRPCPEGGPPRGYDEHDIADRMRMRGWVLPAYTLPPNLQHITVLRVTLREDFSAQMADELTKDLVHTIKYLDRHHDHTKEGQAARAAMRDEELVRRGTSITKTDPTKQQEIRPC